jgi:hypothetical protein
MTIVLADPINERTSAIIQADLIGDSGAPVAGATLTTLTLSLIDAYSGSVLNGRNAQNVLNQNDVTIDSQGHLTWSMRPADNVIVKDSAPFETHRAIFQGTWSGGAKGFTAVIEFRVNNVQVIV